MLYIEFSELADCAMMLTRIRSGNRHVVDTAYAYGTSRVDSCVDPADCGKGKVLTGNVITLPRSLLADADHQR